MAKKMRESEGSVMADPEKLGAILGKTYKRPKNHDGPGKGDRRRIEDVEKIRANLERMLCPHRLFRDNCRTCTPLALGA